MGGGERWKQRAPILALIAVAIVLLGSALGGEQGFLRVWRLWGDLARASERNFELVQSIAKLSETIRAIREDDVMLARAARSKAHLVQPDEVLYLLPSKEDARAARE
jgi:cell division protein FtsB